MNKKILALLAISMIAISAIAIISIKQNQETTKLELQQKFQLLKTQYEEAKANGYDVSEVERLGIQAKQAFDKGDYKKANELVDEVLKTIKMLAQNKTYPVPIEIKVETICTDGIDNDDDRMVDNDDGDCWIREGPIYETHPYYYDGTYRSMIEKIPEIAKLGVKTIYLLPVWEHENKEPTPNYIYLINNYSKLDPVYGTDVELKELIDTVHEYDMKIVFDFVTCCAAPGSIPYESNWIFRLSLSEIEKRADELGWTLRYATVDGYDIVYHDCDKAGYGGFTNCEFLGKIIGNDVRVYYYPTATFGPAIDRTNPEAVEYFIKAAEYYVKEYDIDGWRLDVPNNHWNPDIISGDNSDLELLRYAKEMSSKHRPDTIYYTELPHLVLGDYALDELSEASYSHAFGKYVLYKIIEGVGNSEELVTLLHLECDAGKYNRTRSRYLEGHGSQRINNAAPQQNKPLLVLMSTVPGVPMIQAGQEIGAKNEWMYEGAGEPQVDWTNGDYELRDFYKKVFGIRNNNNALKYGTIENVLKSGDNTYAYSRTYENETVIVVINFNDGEATSYLNLPFIAETNLKDELSGESFIVSNPSGFKISVPAYGSRILTIKVK